MKFELKLIITKKLEIVEMDAMRRSLRISRMDKIRNENIKQKMGIEGTIVQDIEQKQLIWYGHINLMDDKRLPKAMEWQPQERKKRGRHHGIQELRKQ